MTRSEPRGKLRERGVEKLAEVKRARMETDGEISAIRHERDRGGSGGRASR